MVFVASELMRSSNILLLHKDPPWAINKAGPPIHNRHTEIMGGKVRKGGRVAKACISFRDNHY